MAKPDSTPAKGIEPTAAARHGRKAGPGFELAAWQRREVQSLLAGLPYTATSLREAMDLVMRQAVDTLGWTAAFGRWAIGDRPGSLWYTQARTAEVEALGSVLERGPVVAWNVHGERPLVRLERLIALPETKAREAAKRAGMAGYAVVPVLAERKPVALLELFADVAPPRAGGVETRSEVFGVLDLMCAQLGLIASRERLREAIGRAASHARRQSADLEELRDRVLRAERSAVLYDARTGLPGQEILHDRIRQAIRRRLRWPGETFAVIVAEVEGLDRVDDRRSENGVDDVMTAAARRLAGSTRPADSVAIDGSGRFVMIVEKVTGPADALDVARRVQKELRRPFPLTHSDIRLDARVGLAFAGPGYESPEALLADATAAAVRARGAENRIQVFDRSVEHTGEIHERIRQQLSGAIERRELYLEYQPIVSLRDGRITGLETFMRWKHPELGLVPPDKFIAAAEGTSLIHDLGVWSIQRVCEQIGSWRDRLGSIGPPPVGVNVTGPQLFHADFLRVVRETLESTGIKGRQLRFDIAEADLMSDAAVAASTLDRLQGIGIDLVIDDFGTGFSSLAMLHDLPISALKIDRSFVSERRERTRDWSVARTIVELAKILDVDVIAEGVETREQFLALRQAGCAQAQGFHFSGPVDAEKAEALIRDGYPLDLEAPAR